MSLQRSGFLDALNLTNVAKRWSLDDVGVGISIASAAFNPLTTSACTGGGTMLRFRAARSVQGVVWSALDAADVAGTDVQFETFGNTNSANRSAAMTVVQMLRCAGFELSGLTLLGGRIAPASVVGLRINGLRYADNLIGQTQTSAPVSAIDIGQQCSGVHVSGCAPFGDLEGVLPYSSWLTGSSGNADVSLSDIGTPAAPLSAGTTNRMQGAVSGVNFNGLLLRRVYMQNVRTGMVALTNNSQRVQLVNVWGDGDNVLQLSANDVAAQGCRWTNSTVVANSVYGTHWQDVFTSDTEGRIFISANEPTDASAAQCATSLSTGSGFTGSGGLSMSTLGDSVTWTLPYFALGHTALANSTPTINGTNATTNHAFDFQADTGSGFGAWTELTGANLAAVGAIDPSVGIKLRVRATVTTAANNNLLTNIRIDTVTDAVSQRIQYPITAEYRLTLQNVVADSIVHVETATGTPVTTLTTSGGDVPLVLQAYEDGSPLNNLRIRVRKGSASPYYQPWETLTTAFPGSTSIFVSQISDE